MTTTHTNRRPGGYARFLARAALARVSAACAVGLGLVVLVLHFATLHPISGAPVLVCATLSAGAFLVARHEWSSFERARVGANSEKRVAALLTSLAPVGLLNSLLLGAGGDADHTVLGPMLCVVETKTGRGPVSISGTTMRVGRRQVPGDPVAQAKRQATAVGRAAGTYCDAIVCVTDATTAPFVSRGVTVCSLADLGRVISSLPPRLNTTQAQSLYNHLAQLDQNKN